MNWIFILACLLLLVFNLEPIRIPFRNKFVLIWSISDFCIVQVFPHDVYVLIEGGVCYVYQRPTSDETYVSAIRLDTEHQHNVLNYKYLFEWIEKIPRVVSYSSGLTDIVDILNHVRSKIE